MEDRDLPRRREGAVEPPDLRMALPGSRDPTNRKGLAAAERELLIPTEGAAVAAEPTQEGVAEVARDVARPNAHLDRRTSDGLPSVVVRILPVAYAATPMRRQAHDSS